MFPFIKQLRKTLWQQSLSAASSDPGANAVRLPEPLAQHGISMGGYLLAYRWEFANGGPDVLPNFLELPDLEVLVKILFTLPGHLFLPGDKWIDVAFLTETSTRRPIVYRYYQYEEIGGLPRGHFAIFNRNSEGWELLTLAVEGLTYYTSVDNWEIYAIHEKK